MWRGCHRQGPSGRGQAGAPTPCRCWGRRASHGLLAWGKAQPECAFPVPPRPAIRLWPVPTLQPPVAHRGSPRLLRPEVHGACLISFLHLLLVQSIPLVSVFADESSQSLWILVLWRSLWVSAKEAASSSVSSCPPLISFHYHPSHLCKNSRIMPPGKWLRWSTETLPWAFCSLSPLLTLVARWLFQLLRQQNPCSLQFLAFTSHMFPSSKPC